MAIMILLKRVSSVKAKKKNMLPEICLNAPESRGLGRRTISAAV